MTTSQSELLAEKLDAEFKEAEARLQLLQAKAEARNAKADMDEISGLTAAKDRVKKNIADLKQRASTNYAAAKESAEQGLRELQAKIQRADERYAAWDEARERRFEARLDEAEARAKVWKAKADQKRSTQSMKFQEDLVNLEGKIANAKARVVEVHREHSQKAQEALTEAERNFDKAFETAKRHFEQQ